MKRYAQWKETNLQFWFLNTCCRQLMSLHYSLFFLISKASSNLVAAVEGKEVLFLPYSSLSSKNPVLYVGILLLAASPPPTQGSTMEPEGRVGWINQSWAPVLKAKYWYLPAPRLQAGCIAFPGMLHSQVGWCNDGPEWLWRVCVCTTTMTRRDSSQRLLSLLFSLLEKREQSLSQEVSRVSGAEEEEQLLWECEDRSPGFQNPHEQDWMKCLQP